MCRTEVRPTLGALATLMIALAISANAEAVPQTSGQQPNPRWHFSHEMFRMLFEQRGVTPIDHMENALSEPSRSVILLFGNQPQMNRSRWLRLRGYVAQGGSLLIATESETQIPGLCRIIPGPVASSASSSQYQSFADCLSITTEPGDHPLTSGITRLVLNRSGWLTPSEDDSLDWTTLAVVPRRCQPTAAIGQPVLMCGLDQSDEGGVMIVSADKSLFSNGMLWHGDNSILAIRAAELLCRGRRTRLFVMADGRTLSSVQESPALRPPQNAPTPPRMPPAMPPVKPDLATMIRMANLAADKMQESNLLNETLRDQPRNMRPLAWLRTILLILSLAALAVILWKLMQRRTQLASLPAARFMQSMFGAATAKQVERSEFGSAVEVLARDVCRDLSGSNFETEWLKLTRDDQPLLSKLSRRQQTRLKELVRFAISGCREHFSRRRFEAVGRLVTTLRELKPTPGAVT